MDYIAELVSEYLGGGTAVTIFIVTAVILLEVKPVRKFFLKIVTNPKKAIRDSQIKERMEKSDVRNIDPRESIYKANRRFKNEKYDK